MEKQIRPRKTGVSFAISIIASALVTVAFIINASVVTISYLKNR